MEDIALNWIGFPNESLVVNGLAWFNETTPRLWRLPERLKSVVRPPLWELALQPSGGRIRFSTEATALAIRLHYPSLAGMVDMHKIGQFGLDLYVDNEYCSTVYPVDQPDVEASFFADAPALLRNVCIYLPLYAPVEVKAIGLSDGAQLWPPGPFAVPRPVVYYGSSITQGACASRSGMSYQAILSRDLLLDYVNLGFNGNGKGDREIAAAMAEIDAACYVLDFAQNCDSPAQLRKVYGPFIDTLREAHARTPILCITPIFASAEGYSKEADLRYSEMRKAIRDAVSERTRRGDQRLHAIDGTRLLGCEDSDGLTDGLHPNDLGFQRMAERLSVAILEALKASL